MKKKSRKTDKLGCRRYSQSECRELIREYHGSGKTQAAFSRARGVEYATFCGWLRRTDAATSGAGHPAGFAEVELPPRDAPALEAEVACPGGKILRLRNLQASADHAAFIREVLSC